MSDLNNVQNGKKSVQKHRIKLVDHVFEHASTVAHVCVAGFTTYIIYLCFLEPVVLFTWHPLLLSIGWMLLMVEGVLMINKDNIFSNRITHNLRVRNHWILESLAVLTSITGFIIILVVKEDNNREHFTSWHGIFGLSSIIFCTVCSLGGIPALFSKELKDYIKPTILKCLHATCGIITVVLGGVTIVLSLYTGWFENRTGGNRDIFVICYIAVCFAILWSLLRPAITFFERLKSF